MGYICEGSTEFEQFIYFTLPLVPLTLCHTFHNMIFLICHGRTGPLMGCLTRRDVGMSGLSKWFFKSALNTFIKATYKEHFFGEISN